MVYTEHGMYTAVRRRAPHHCTRSPPEAMPLRNRGVLSATPCRETTVGVSFTTMLHTPVGFGQRFLSVEKCANSSASLYSSGLAPSGVYLFLRLKSALKGRSFFDTADIKNGTEELKRLSQICFQKCFKHLCSHWQKCTNIFAQGDYFEGNIA
jgi:hypothetical protein